MTGPKVESIEEDYPISADPSKYVTLPVQHEKIWNKYQVTLDNFWTVYDVYLTSDKDVMKTIFNEEQTQYILRLLAFMFTAHYTAINKELFMQFMNQADIKEAVYYFGSQADAKKTHSMMYFMLLDELTRDEPGRKDKLVREMASSPDVRDFLRWSVHNTTSSTLSFGQRLLSFATLQGIIFTVPFVMLNWLQKQHKNFMPGLAKSNRLIWDDEKLNLSFSCLMFDYIEEEMNNEEAHRIIGEAVCHAKKLFTKTIPVSQIGMDCDLIEQFIEHSADVILSSIHAAKLYNRESPFDWIEERSVETYQSKSNGSKIVDASLNLGGTTFDLNEDF